jgi:uncharacterized membrane protein (DUF2068 family)
MSEEPPTWPAKDPWWRHTPRNLTTGYLALIAFGLVLAVNVYAVLREQTTTKALVFAIALIVISLVGLFSAATGLKSLRHRMAVADRRDSRP